MLGRWWPGGLLGRMEGLPLPLQPRKSNNAWPRRQAERARQDEGRRPWPWYTRQATPSGIAAPSAPPTRSLSRGDGHQADVPTQEALPAQNPRVSHSYGDARRSSGAQSASPQGPQAADSGRTSMNRRHRLPGRRRIAAVRESGSEARSGPVRVRAIRGETEVSRVAFAVPAAGGSVCRNRARRRLRAAIAPLLVDRPALDVLVSLPGSAAEMPFPKLSAALATALDAAGRQVLAQAHG